MSSALFVPMGSGKVKPQVDRTYGESHALQWVREAFVNAREAGATKVHFGIEWHGVEATGTYRRIIADNGSGILPDDHARFFNTFGGGGKAIGGPHENYGIGFKTSVLPWNKLGVVVISLRDGIESMSRVYLNEKADEYGMKVELAEDGELLSVWEPIEDDEFQVDWSQVIPDFVRDAGHGTVLVLLGNNPEQDTILGDPDRAVEANVDAIVKYLNQRFWDLTDIDVSVDGVLSSDKRRWPEAGAPKSGGGRESSWTTLRPLGMYPATINRETTKSKLTDWGSINLADGLVEADWYLRTGDPLPSTRAQNTGFIAALYHGEVYNLNDHASLMRSFGVGAIRSNAFVILRAREAETRLDGVYPDTSRTGLKLGGATGGVDLPLSDWAQEFGSRLPDEIINAIRATMSNVDGEITDEEWKKRLAERYGSRWRITKLLLDPNGDKFTTAVQAIGRGKRKKSPRRPVRPNQFLPESEKPKGKPRIGDPDPQGAPASEKSVAGGLPDYRIVQAKEIGENGDWALAVYQPPNKVDSSGVVLINRDHKVLKQHIDELSKKYPEHLADTVEREVLKVYGEIAVAHVAHSEQMKKLVPASKVEADFRSDAALTMALLGLWQIEAVALPRLQGKLQQAQLKNAS